MTDGIFPLNEAQASYDCLSALGGDVRLYTYPFSHAAPAGLGHEGFASAGATCSGPDCFALFQGYVNQYANPGAFGQSDLTGCGNYDEPSMEVLWMRAKLQRDDAAIGALADAPRRCLTLGSGGDAITLDGFTPPAPVQAIIPALTVINSVQAAPQTTKLVRLDGGNVLAGIPKAPITLASALPGPVVAADPIVFVGLARSRFAYGPNCHQYADPYPFAPMAFCAPVEAAEAASGQSASLPAYFETIDDQLVPIRGLGTHSIDLNGVAERLGAGEEVHLIVTSYNPFYFATGSRDGALPLTVTGSVDLPFLGDRPALTSALP